MLLTSKPQAPVNIVDGIRRSPRGLGVWQEPSYMPPLLSSPIGMGRSRALVDASIGGGHLKAMRGMFPHELLPIPLGEGEGQGTGQPRAG